MEIKIISGQRGICLEKYTPSIGNVILYPEIQYGAMHSYDLVDKILPLCQEFYDKNEDLVIVTYSETVLDAVRLWVARTGFDGASCDQVVIEEQFTKEHTNYMTTEVKNSKINIDGQMDSWEVGVFDVKTVILGEMFTYRRNGYHGENKTKI